jgi:hypothetical protein
MKGGREQKGELLKRKGRERKDKGERRGKSKLKE